jgi:uncharacterized Zn finger protein (UPF0148 family)
LKLRLQKAAEEQKNMAAAEKKRLKDMHWMHCPKCGHPLVAEPYGKVEVDVCPACKGIWLDANELETIIRSKNKVFGSFLKILGGK